LLKRTTVESIALLERVSNRKADAKVHIDVDLEDYYRIKDAQGKDGK
jgi:23S rRNA (uracil1939-C5)-methyltransferase